MPKSSMLIMLTHSSSFNSEFVQCFRLDDDDDKVVEINTFHREYKTIDQYQNDLNMVWIKLQTIDLI